MIFPPGLKSRERYLLTAIIVIIAGSLAYLFYAAWRGWISTDTLTLIMTTGNTALLVLLLKRWEGAG